MSRRNPEVRAARLANGLAAALFALVAAYMLIVAVTELSYMDRYAPGPGFLPAWVGAASLVVAAIIGWQTWRGAFDVLDEPLPRGTQLKRVLAYSCGSFLTVMLFDVMGTFISLGLFLITELVWVERQPWPRAVPTALATPLLVYLVFQVWLGIRLPDGVLGF
ncbi:MAG TPA: tripartite tricarboxylate transporter TctB family protein [Bacillota bacterium]